MRRQIMVLIVAVLGVALLAGATFKLVLPAVEKTLMEEKRLQAMNLTDVALGVLAACHRDETKGRLTRAQAQTRAKERIRELRYGLEKKNYFWIINLEPVMIMHPYRPELEGWDLTGYVDRTGKALFVRMVDRVRKNGSGFVNYFWQWQDNPTRVAAKLSFVSEFKPWGWIVGTGVYLDDLKVETATLRDKLACVGLAVLAGLMGIFTFIFFRNLKTDRLRRLAEEKARETADLYRTVLQSAPNAIMVYDRQGRARYTNTAFERAFGWGLDQLGRGRTNLVPPHCRRQTDEAIQAARSEPGRIISYQSQRRNLKGEILDVKVNTASFTDAEGRVDGLVINLEDITAQKKTEKELADYRRLLETVVDELPFWISLKDIEGKFVIVNRNMTREVGSSREEFIGRTTGQVPGLHPGGADKLAARDRQVIETGRWLEVGEFPVQTEAGLHWRRMVKMPWRGEQGEVLGVITWSEDITERKVSRDRLRQYQRIVDSSTDLQALIGADLRYLMVNRALARAYGYAIKEIIGLTVAQVVGEEFFQANLKDRVEACLQGQVVNFSLWVEPPNLGRRFFHTAYYPYHDQTGAVVGYVVHTRDMTENRNLEMQLRQSQKMEAIGTLAGGIAHDFNNILAAIMGYTELALGDLKPGHPAAPNLQRVLTSSDRAKRLVQQILSFSRKGELELRPVDLGETVLESLEMLRSTLPATISLEQRIETGLGVVMADPAQIHQVVMNLVTNAAQALGESGRIEIDVERLELFPGPGNDYPDLEPGEFVRLTVRDNGPGIQPGALDRIFEPFFTTKEQGQGTGMGLSVVHGIVESHHGHLTVSSQPGQGAEFQILLPMAEPTEPVPAPAPAEIAAGAEGKYILFIDDEPAIRDMMARMLGRKGFEVTLADSPHQALKIMKSGERRFDLVITDQTMPGITGLELAAQIKAAWPDLPIILCSGAATQVLLEKAKRAGVDHLVAKPVVSQELLTMIRDLLAD